MQEQLSQLDTVLKSLSDNINPNSSVSLYEVYAKLLRLKYEIMGKL